MSTDTLFSKFGKEYPAGQVLFRQGDAGKEMFVIQEGAVRISVESGGKEKILVELGPGEFLGEMAILNNKPRIATATVTKNSKLLVVNPELFDQMIRGNAEIAVRMIRKLANRLEEADEQIKTLMIKDNKAKVVHMLCNLAEKKGTPVTGGIDIGMSAAGLARSIGMEEEEVREILSGMVKSQLVADQGQTMIVASPDKLRKYLEFLALKEQFGEL